MSAEVVQPQLSQIEDAKTQSKEPSEESKALLAAFQEDMNEEVKMLNELYGDKLYPLKKPVANSTS